MQSPRLQRACLPKIVQVLTVILIMLGGILAFDPQRAMTQSPVGTIAYIRADTLDEIRLIEPDGGNDRLLWAISQPDPDNRYYISGLAWKPHGSELAFSGNHEDHCSLFDQDLYAIRPDGSGYRRITNGPACTELAAYPQGRVRVKVENTSLTTRNIWVNFQGADEPQPLTLPPLGSGEVLFNQVADLGIGPQFAVGIEGTRRWINAASAEVEPGGLVETPPLLIDAPDTIFAAYRPSWRYDGTKLAFTFASGAYHQIEANPPVGAQGSPLFTSPALPYYMGPAYYAPVAGRSNQLIYYRSDFAQTAIFQITEGSTDGGAALAAPNWDEYVQYGQAWLPDGSGFLYAVRSMFGGSKLFEYSFAAGSTTLIAEFADHAGAPGVSPGGQQIVFERGSSSDLVTGIITDPDLWIINRDGSGLRLLVENARLPVWSLQDPTTPPTTPTTQPEETQTPTLTATPPLPVTPPSSTATPTSTPTALPTSEGGDNDMRIYLPVIQN
jgi:hypothetical protein